VLFVLYSDAAVECGDKEIQDTTAVNDVDSGLQMATSPCSALSAVSMTSTAFKDPQCSGRFAITTTGISGRAGVRQLRLSAAS